MNNYTQPITSRKSKTFFTTSNITKIAVLSAASFGLMMVSFPLAFIFPSFLKMDLSDVPALLGAFAMGPIAGITVEFIKNVLNILIKGTETGGVGELSNFIVGTAYIVPASLIYNKIKSRKGAIIGMLAGAVTMTIVACFSNYYLILPLYQRLFPFETILAMMNKANSAIVDIRTYIIFAVVPFNMLKAAVVSIVTLLFYKKLSVILHK